jgi:hypothetical protein
MRQAAELTYPTEIPEGYLDEVDQEYQERPLGELKEDLREKLEEFEKAGGRGVELADEIDDLNVAIAMREAADPKDIRRA